jgi:hypothetical protein
MGVETTDTEAEIATPQGTAATDGMEMATGTVDGMMGTITITGVTTPIITAITDTVTMDTDTIRTTVPGMRMPTHSSCPPLALVLA